MSEEENKTNNQTNQSQRNPITVADIVRQLSSEGGVLANVSNDIAEILRKLGEALVKHLRESLSQISKSLAAFLQEFAKTYKIAEEEVTRTLKKYKWFFYPSIPMTLLFNVISVSREKGNQRAAINKLFVKYYLDNDCEKLIELVERWRFNPIFEPRMKILRDCVVILRLSSKKFNSSNVVLPTLIAQIDGVLTEITKQHRRDLQWKTYFRQKTQLRPYSELANEILLEFLFQRAITGQPLDVPFTFNRHKIMHGENITYGRIDNVLRAFFILDFLAHIR